MGETSIAWTETVGPDGTTHTGFSWNPWIGCTKVSAGCKNCYAERENDLYGWNKAGWGKGIPRHRTSAENWRKPFKWNLEAQKLGVRLKVFCLSLGDILDEEVDQIWRDQVWKIIEITQNLDWLLLTKRLLPSDRENRFPVASWMRKRFPENVWLLSSVEDQETADLRIPILLTYRNLVKVLGLSIEPLIAPVTLSRWLRFCPVCGEIPAFRSDDWEREDQNWIHKHSATDRTLAIPLGKFGLDWVIVGGESGPDCREMMTDWALDLKHECKDNNVPFFFKQMGGYPYKRTDPGYFHEDLNIREFPR